MNMLSLGDTLLAAVGKVLPQKVINGIGRIENVVDTGITNLAKSNYKYFGGAAKKMDTAGNIAKEFVTFCQNYIYVPTLFVVVICIIIFALGNTQEKTGAKHRLLCLVFGIAGLMSTLTIVSLIMSFLTPDTSADLVV